MDSPQVDAQPSGCVVVPGDPAAVAVFDAASCLAARGVEGLGA
jgi:hypothetical protein